MDPMSNRRCPDCGLPLIAIRLVFPYSLITSKPSLWTGAYPVEGTVSGFLCGECGRVTFYARTATDSLPLSAGEPTEVETDDLPRPV
jgi:predicted RNA-binding Zn-ribbon protein involved in translation (DUF1610 family)